MRWKQADIPGRWVSISDHGSITICKDFKRIIKTPSITANGVPYICIKGRTYYVHRLVALAFCPNPRGYKFVIFLKGHDLHYKNLRWVKSIPHQAHDGARLTIIDVMCIKRAIAAGARAVSVARRFEVDKSLISHIKAGRRWKNV